MSEMADQYGIMDEDSESDMSGIYFAPSLDKTSMPLNYESDENHIKTEDELELSDDNITKRSPYYLRSSRSCSPEPNTSSIFTEEELFYRRQTILPSEAENMFPKVQFNKRSKEGRLQELKQKYDDYSLPAIEEIEDDHLTNEEDPKNLSMETSLPHPEINDPYVLNINVHIPKEFSDKDIPLHVNIIKDSSRASINDTLHDNNDTTMESNTSSVPYGENSMISLDEQRENEEHAPNEDVNRAFIRHESALSLPGPSSSVRPHKLEIQPSTSKLEHNLQQDHIEIIPNQTSLEELNPSDEVQKVDNKSKGKKKVTRKTKPKEEKKESKSAENDKPKRKSTRRSKKTSDHDAVKVPEQQMDHKQNKAHVPQHPNPEDHVHEHRNPEGYCSEQSEPEEHGIDHNEPEEHVIDHNEPEEHVIDHNEPEEHVLEHHEPEEHVLDHHEPEERVLDHHEPEEHVLDHHEPEEHVLDLHEPEEHVPEQPLNVGHTPDQPTSEPTGHEQSETGVSASEATGQALPEPTVTQPPQTRSLRDELLELKELKKDRKAREKKEREDREKLKKERAKKRKSRRSKKQHKHNKHNKSRKHKHCCCSSSNSSDSSDSVCSVCDGEVCGGSFSSSSTSCDCGCCSSPSSYSSSDSD